MLCMIGDVEIWRILESEGPLMPFTRFFPGLTGEVLQGHRDMLEHGGLYRDPDTGEDWISMPIQAFLLRTPQSLVLVDACIGNHKTLPEYPQWHDQRSRRFLAALAAAGAALTDIDYVLCTHLHLDHVGWTTRMTDGHWSPTFANAKVLTTQVDLDLARQQAAADPADLPARVWRESIQPLLEAGCLETVSPDHRLDDYVRLKHTPGHTPGHVAVEIRAPQKLGGAITGDLIHSPIQFAMPGLSVISDHDPLLAGETRRLFLETMATTGALTLGMHLPLPSIGRVGRRGTAYTWDKHI